MHARSFIVLRNASGNERIETRGENNVAFLSGRGSASRESFSLALSRRDLNYRCIVYPNFSLYGNLSAEVSIIRNIGIVREISERTVGWLRLLNLHRATNEPVLFPAEFEPPFLRISDDQRRATISRTISVNRVRDKNRVEYRDGDSFRWQGVPFSHCSSRWAVELLSRQPRDSLLPRSIPLQSGFISKSHA